MTDAMDHHKQTEAATQASIALHAQTHLDSVASQTLPIAHARAERQQYLSTIPDIQGHGFNRIRRIGEPLDKDTPGASSSGSAPPTQQRGRSRSREPNSTRSRSEAPVYTTRVKDTDFQNKTINTIIQQYRKDELKQYLKGRGFSDEKLSIFDMATKLKEHDTKENKANKTQQINAEFDKPGKSQRAKSLEALKARGIKG